MTPNHKLAECAYIYYFNFQQPHYQKVFFSFCQNVYILLLFLRSLLISYFLLVFPISNARTLFGRVYIYTYPPATVAYPCLVFESDICSFSLYNIPYGTFIFKIFQQHNLTLDIYSIFFFIAIIVIQNNITNLLKNIQFNNKHYIHYIQYLLFHVR